jgi:glycosyltransferase involved in cell wall biosynthesis
MTPNGGVVISKRFVTGMQKYVEYWDGPVSAFMESSDVPTSIFDETEVDPANLPFKLELVSFADPKLGRLLAGQGLVLATVYCRQNHIAALCRSARVPCVYVAEFSLKTRLQIQRAEVRNPVILLRRHLWEINQERLHRRAIRLASGIQCNGTPTFEAYRSVSASPLLFFDTRVSEDMLITERELAERVAQVQSGDPLRLLFSGRLIQMKGADHLIPVATELRRLGVPFKMTICGGGDLEPAIKADIERLQLGDCVKPAGILDFKTELTSLTKHRTDLFVCCHRTGDPSGTYVDAMACGVPFIGYDNEALSGIARQSRAAWIVPMNQPEKLAAEIAELNKNRLALAEAAKRAADFGRRNAFEPTFKLRIEHMQSCVPRAAEPVGLA